MNRNLIVIVVVGFYATLGCLHSTPATFAGDDVNPGSKPETATPSLESALLKDQYRFVPLTREKQISELFARCTVNGKPVLLLLDTGSSWSCLSQDVAETLGLDIKETSARIAFIGTEAKKSKVARVNEFRVAESPSISIDFCVADFSALRKMARDNKQIVLDGILGANWLGHNSCVIDFGHDRLYYLEPAIRDRFIPFNPPSEDSDDAIRTSVIGAALMKEGYEFVRTFQNSKTADLFLSCRVKGKSVCFWVDTGCVNTMLSFDVAKALNLTLVDSPTELVSIGDKTRRVKHARVNDIQIGELNVEMPSVDFDDFTAARQMQKQSGKIEYDGLLGTDFLARMSVVIDYRHDVLYYLVPNRKEVALFTGSWKSTRVCRSGIEESNEKARDWSLSISDGNVELRDGNVVRKVLLGLTPVPRNGIDIAVLSSTGPDKGKRMHGIYEFSKSGQKLTICISTRDGETNRPTSMGSKKGSDVLLIEFERIVKK